MLSIKMKILRENVPLGVISLENDIWSVLHAENIRRGRMDENQIIGFRPRTNPGFQGRWARIVQNNEMHSV